MNEDVISRAEFEAYKETLDKRLIEVYNKLNTFDSMSDKLSVKLDDIAKSIKESQEKQGARIGQLEKNEIDTGYRFKELDRLSTKVEGLYGLVVTKEELMLVLEPFKQSLNKISNSVEASDKRSSTTAWNIIKWICTGIGTILLGYIAIRLGLK